MGTAHGAEGLGLCSHGLACQAGAKGRYIAHRVLPRIWPYLAKNPDMLTNPRKSYGHHTWCQGARPVLPWACMPWPAPGAAI